MAFSLPSDIQTRGQKNRSSLATLAGTFVAGDLKNRQTELSLEKERAEKMFIRSTLGDLYGQLEGTKNPMDYNKRMDESSLKLLSYGGEKSSKVAEELGKRRLRLPSRGPLATLLGTDEMKDPEGKVIGERERFGFPSEEEGGKESITRTEERMFPKTSDSAGRVIGRDGFYYDAVKDAKGNVTYKKSNVQAPEGKEGGEGDGAYTDIFEFDESGVPVAVKPDAKRKQRITAREKLLTLQRQLMADKRSTLHAKQGAYEPDEQEQFNPIIRGIEHQEQLVQKYLDALVGKKVEEQPRLIGGKFPRVIGGSSKTNKPKAPIGTMF